MIKYYYENDTAYQQRLFKVDGNNYWMIYPRPNFEIGAQKLKAGSRNLLKTHYTQVPDLFAVLVGVKI